ncbi:hypothetical protein B0J11DRAFT_39748 [Dendryphion nanum]|uniref:Secreted protein n=1 Tax=Dendryphion nanum TaxID=256645 RepID=A0A9P9EKD6_9PLEO|nr:hypothetical protein B0J11DRAFT_39748 [Dendryphion nanum]
MCSDQRPMSKCCMVVMLLLSLFWPRRSSDPIFMPHRIVPPWSKLHGASASSKAGHARGAGEARSAVLSSLLPHIHADDDDDDDEDDEDDEATPQPHTCIHTLRKRDSIGAHMRLSGSPFPLGKDS